MKTIFTLGSGSKKSEFSYSGSVNDGVVLNYTGNPTITVNFFSAILNHFKGKTIPGGFSMTDPTPGGFGEWIQVNSTTKNRVSLTPRHASHIAAILVHEGYIKSSLKGNAVYLHF